MRNFGAVILLLVAQMACAQEWEDRQLFNAEGETSRLRILSSTDTELFAPMIHSFLADKPGISVEYLVTGTADIDRLFRDQPNAYDIVVSSAMDLQLKLANDGFARRLEDISHPDWGEWRQSLFAFTTEPAAIVINRAAFAGLPVPQSRQDLIEVLRSEPDRFRDKVGTYDVRQSGLGYLFATQDARATETFWRLMEVMGALDVRLYCCSGDMIDDLILGRIAVAYNVLGSYAQARSEDHAELGIVLPSDFPTTMMRTAFVSAQSTKPVVAGQFVAHLAARQAGEGGAQSALPTLMQGADTSERAIIGLDPALMTFLDRLKRQKVLAEWESAVIQE